MLASARKLIALSLVASGLHSTTGALAADNPALTPAPASWTGLYVGGDIGGLFAHTTHATADPTVATDGIGSISGHPSFGLIGGVNLQIGAGLVIGLEGQINRFAKLNFREYGPDLDFLQRVESLTSVTGRFGILLTPDTLAYARLGAARIGTSGFEGFGDTFHKTIMGVQAGAGIETRVTPNISLRGEALYTHASDQLKLNEGFDTYRPSLIQYKLGAIYRFDAPQGWGYAGAGAEPVGFWAFGRAGEPAWTGLSLGGFGSINGRQMSWAQVSGDLGPFTALSGGIGGFVGGNIKLFSMAVLGVEVSGNFARSNFIEPAGTGLAQQFHRFASVDQVRSATARVGWLATPGTLLYVKAGPATINMSVDNAYWNALAPNTTGGKSMAAWQFGLGVETFVTSSISLRVEGLRTRATNAVVMKGTQPDVISLRPSDTSGAVGVAYHF